MFDKAHGRKAHRSDVLDRLGQVVMKNQMPSLVRLWWLKL